MSITLIDSLTTSGEEMQKKWNILIIPNTSDEGYNITFTESAVKTGLIGLCLFLLAGSIFCAASMHAWKKGNRKQVIELKNELVQQGSELSSLKSEYATIILLEEKLRTIAGLKPRHPQLAEAAAGGQGGPETEEMNLYEPQDEAMRFLADLKQIPTDRLHQAFVDTKDSFAEILEAFEKEQDRLSNVPSINPVSHPDAWISSSFGYRRDPINGKRSFHDGLDIVAPRKTPVIAPAEGVVTFAGWREGLGRAIEIQHGYGYRTIYGHNDKVVVKKGDYVKRGDTIALLGSSGRSTGPHLHYEIRLADKLVNPYKYVIE
ncbi:MAG: M23 family metallopeptidase [Candidatus Abyssobacteria bacterium SURF_5]|uniref:M23 family metallopeptidase n=1 Tax=Abyssobacteria bacterium (strain SURF_5) TaxID=2093360 RepID=A0A3A4NKD3_ABYX5|nr:MAG: M23 family metallopeptidase [Candidatus Abyssubacteria bacterium SURF_5]